MPHSISGSCTTKVAETCLCGICGNKVKVLEAGSGTLICCGQPMRRTAK